MNKKQLHLLETITESIQTTSETLNELVKSINDETKGTPTDPNIGKFFESPIPSNTYYYVHSEKTTDLYNSLKIYEDNQIALNYQLPKSYVAQSLKQTPKEKFIHKLSLSFPEEMEHIFADFLAYIS